MAKQLQLNIPTPCHESWDKMTPVEKGRFCDSCQKQVVDFSTMSDRQVAEFFKKPSTGSVCGRFMADQLDRDIEIPRKRIPWLKYFFQFALPAFLLSLKSSSAKAQGTVSVKKTENRNGLYPKRIVADTIIMEEVVVVAMPQVVQPKDYYSSGLENNLQNTLAGRVMGPTITTVYTAKDDPFTRDLSQPAGKAVNLQNGLTGKMGGLNVVITKKDQRTINGLVVDEKGDPLPGASISIKGTKTGVSADNTGQFRILAKTGDVLVVSGAMLETTETTVGKTNELTVIVKQIVIECREVVITGLISQSTISARKKKKEIPLLTAELKDSAFKFFKIFPNPLQAGSRLNIEWKENEEGNWLVQLVDQSGQQVYQEQRWIDTKTRSFGIETPVLAAGHYILVIVNKKTGKRHSEKLIIQ